MYFDSLFLYKLVITILRGESTNLTRSSVFFYTGCVFFNFGADVSKAQTSSTASAKDRLQAIKEKGVLTIASANDKPFAYTDPQTNK